MFYTHFWGLVSDYMVKKVIFWKNIFFNKNKIFLKILKLKFYYAKWTLRIEVVNGNFFLFIIVISEFI
jgi:hypothetical protein